jgi:hypothetical protein
VDGRDKPGHDGGANGEGQPFRTVLFLNPIPNSPTLHRKNSDSGDALIHACRNG